ncbi:DUF4133 domain-containing protein [Mucilaginibacter sp. 21P]|uniref:DUF4133 domain-containing protein n=1 Tax=Mucilaginibacter sp. 21P TaxID=2778902 RepID=UPI001C58DA93|nr:DUF4133 domain-containing protein [Mucilaginibacter sp. 21P]QXV64010.1 DUF4133 domain-containing protein [Mucilaginibacter sp. 21P]
MSYRINKSINSPIEFKGLKAQYIGYLGGGLVALLVMFAVLYLIGLAIYLCLLIIGGLGSALFYKVFKLSHRYGEHGLMKYQAKRYLPTYLKFKTRRLFHEKR